MAFTFVQNVASSTVTGSHSAQTLTVPAAGVGAGHVLALWFLWDINNTGAFDNITIADSAGNTYVKVFTEAGVSINVDLWVVLSTKALASGNTITLTFHTTFSLLSQMTVLEFAPPAGGVVSLDQTSGSLIKTGTSSTAPTATSGTVTNTTELILSGVGFKNTVNATETLTAAGSFINSGAIQAWNGVSERCGIFPQYQLPASASGTYAGGGTLGNSATWHCGVATYKAVVPAPASLPPSGIRVLQAVNRAATW